MYGWRSKMGLLVPTVNLTMEADFHRLAPEGVSVHTCRVDFAREGTIETLMTQEKNAQVAAQLMAVVEPDVVVYGCTSGSFVGGTEWNASIEEALGRTCKCAAVTTTRAMVEASHALGLKKLFVVTPYVQATNDRLADYLQKSGLSITDMRGFDMLDTYAHAGIQPSAIYDVVKRHVPDAADGIFIACTQLRALELVDTLERDFGRPVVTANQASFWAAIRSTPVGEVPAGPGRLFREWAGNRDSRQ